jgi:hypothetical protein
MDCPVKPGNDSVGVVGAQVALCCACQTSLRHSGAPRSGEPGIQTTATSRVRLDSGFALARAPE